MKAINKYRFFNPYVFLSIGSLFIILAVSWAFESHFMEVMFFMDYGAEDLIDAPAAEIRHNFLFGGHILTWESFIDAAMRHLVNFLPLFAIIPVLPFAKERSSYFIFGSNRFASYGRTQFRTILCYALISGLCISVAFSLYFTIGTTYMVPSITYIGEFASIFPEDFYSTHPYLFFMFMTWSIYFTFGFTFGLLTCGIAMWTKKSYYILLLPLLYYLASNYLSAMFQGFLPLELSACVTAFNTLYSTLETFVPLLLPVALALLLIATGMRNERRLLG
nr:hypothetical protein [Evansella caseinilytica]